MKTYDEEKRARLLQFVTGSSRVPVQGFKALQGILEKFKNFVELELLIDRAYVRTAFVIHADNNSFGWSGWAEWIS